MKPVLALLAGFWLAACARAETAARPNAGCATAHPEATAACVAILLAGGNAVDAAIAATAALAVVEPTGSGMGGGGFWLLHLAETGRYVFLDGRETAPAAARLEHYRDARGEVVPERSLFSVLGAGIPGQPRALEHLATRYGRLPLARTLAPAERLAREGFAVDALLAEAFERHWPRFDEGARATFAIEGRAPRAGERLVQPDLAALLAAMGGQGAAAFYEGPYAERLVSGVRAKGGHWQLSDLARYRVVEREPVIAHFRGARIISAPPPSAGGVALAQIFGQLEALAVPLPLTAEDHHLLVEAMRRAYRDRARHLGDPDQVFVPTAWLAGSAHARALARGIDRGRATPSAALGQGLPVGEGENTTHLSVMDAAGNRVAATLSINLPFGAGIVVPGTGILLNNELDDFALGETARNVYELIGSRANLLAPGKRPLSSMSPSFVEGPRGVLAVGTPGGSRIITMVALAVADWLGGASLEALAARGRLHHQFWPDRVEHEPEGVDPAVLAALSARGHALHAVNRRYGNLQAVAWHRDTDAVEAVSDPRGVGRAAVIHQPLSLLENPP